MSNILLTYFAINVVLLSLMFLLGLIVKIYNVRVNYTRKIVHFSLFVVPVGIYNLVTEVSNLQQLVIITFSAFTVLFCMTQFCCQKCSFYILL